MHPMDLCGHVEISHPFDEDRTEGVMRRINRKASSGASIRDPRARF